MSLQFKPVLAVHQWRHFRAVNSVSTGDHQWYLDGHLDGTLVDIFSKILKRVLSSEITCSDMLDSDYAAKQGTFDCNRSVAVWCGFFTSIKFRGFSRNDEIGVKESFEELTKLEESSRLFLN